MSNRLLPYDTIIKAHEGDPIAIQAVLDRYAGYIRYFSKMTRLLSTLIWRTTSEQS